MREIPALRVRQWLPEWDSVNFSDLEMRRHPPHYFHVFSISARELRALSGIQRRSAQDRELGYTETGIQRRHDRRRSTEIEKYIRYGFPYADFSERDRRKFGSRDAKMPGWLPTAIVVNIFNPEFPDSRRGQVVAKDDHIGISEGPGAFDTIRLPRKFQLPGWSPQELPPIEVIDGQHRLWAFDGSNGDEDFELPVVAFYGLDLSWQAYLFYTINIRPVKINTSLAFDLYPLLRTESWLQYGEGPRIYRETRAQEVVQSLYSHPNSPWHQHINMLGEPGLRMVRQAAWIRSLLATYIKPTTGRGISIGGLFGSTIPERNRGLEWDGAQQVAFIIYIGRVLQQQVEDYHGDWATAIRSQVGNGSDPSRDPAFYGRHSLLNTDQGIRGLLAITNDLTVSHATDLKLWSWITDDFGRADDGDAVTFALESLEKHKVSTFVKNLMERLCEFDWRSSSTPGLTDEERMPKLGLRGSSGYREIRRQLLQYLANYNDEIGRLAGTVLKSQRRT